MQRVIAYPPDSPAYRALIEQGIPPGSNGRERARPRAVRADGQVEFEVFEAPRPARFGDWVAATRPPSLTATATPALAVWLHGLGYAALGAAVGLALMGRGRSAWLIAWCAITGYGLMLEVLQSLTPTRSFEVKDIGIDAIGAALGLGLTWALTSLGYRLRSAASSTRPPHSDTA